MMRTSLPAILSTAAAFSSFPLTTERLIPVTAESGGPLAYCQEKFSASEPNYFECPPPPECRADCDHPKRHLKGCAKTWTCEPGLFCACEEYPILTTEEISGYAICVSSADQCLISGSEPLCQRMHDEGLVDLRTVSAWCSSKSGDPKECTASYLSGEQAATGDQTVTPCISYQDGSCVADWDVLEVCNSAESSTFFCQAVAGKTDVRHASINQWCFLYDDAAECESAFAGGDKAYSPCKYDADEKKCKAGPWVMYPKNSDPQTCGCDPICNE